MNYKGVNQPFKNSYSNENKFINTFYKLKCQKGLGESKQPYFDLFLSIVNNKTLRGKVTDSP